MPPTVLGLDIGGANLKAAHSAGAVLLHPFELWRQPAGLTDALRSLLRAMPRFELLAVTMTGELCDCFESKRHGVHAILDAVEASAAETPMRVWQTDGTFVDIAIARARPLQAAAANWLALAAYAGRFAAKGPSLLVDVGSTTTDIIPLLDGRPVPRGRTDPERLLSRELVYTGVRRTPLCAVLDGPRAAEWFATTLDAYLVLEMVPESPDDRCTADGKPATRKAAHARLARMTCADLESTTVAERRDLAQHVFDLQRQAISDAIARVTATLSGPLETAVLSGSGEFLARSSLELHQARNSVKPGSVGIRSLSAELGPERSDAACAYALAVLASEAG